MINLSLKQFLVSNSSFDLCCHVFEVEQIGQKHT